MGSAEPPESASPSPSIVDAALLHLLLRLVLRDALRHGLLLNQHLVQRVVLLRLSMLRLEQHHLLLPRLHLLVLERGRASRGSGGRSLRRQINKGRGVRCRSLRLNTTGGRVRSY